MMQATIQASALERAMKHSVAQRTGTMPVLQHALVRARGEQLTITTTDLETTVVVTLDAGAVTEGDICARADQLRASSGVGDTITLALDDSAQLLVRHGRSRVRVPALPASEFPDQDDEPWRPLAVDPVALYAALDAVHYASSQKDVRQWIRFVRLRDGFAEATDGFRVARAPIAYEGPTLMIPAARAPALLARLTPGAILEHVGERLLRVTGNGVVFSLLLGAVRMPDLDAIAASATTPLALLSRRALLGALNTIAPFATTSSSGNVLVQPFLRLRFGTDPAALALESPRDDSVHVDDVASVQAPDLIGVPVNQLRQALESAQGDDRIVLARAPHGASHRLVSLHSPDSGDIHCIAEVKL